MRPQSLASSSVRAQQSKKRAHKRKRKIIRIVCIAVVIIATLVLIFRLPLFRIQTVEVTGNQLIQTDDVVAAAWDKLLGNYALIIPNNNIFFMRTKALHSHLLATFPRIAKLDVERGNLRTLQLAIQERPHAFVWCADTTMGDCYFADDNGLLFAKAPYFSESVFLTFFGGDITDDQKIDAHIMHNNEEFDRLVEQVRALEDAGFLVTKVHISSAKNYSVGVSHIKGVRTPNAKIFITTKISPATTVYNIGLAMNTDSFKEAFVRNADMLQYIDARLSEKVFYKFGSQAKPTPAVAQ